MDETLAQSKKRAAPAPPAADTSAAAVAPGAAKSGQSEHGHQIQQGRRKKRRRNREKNKKKPRNRVWQPDIVKENAGFFKYYKAQGDAFLPESEWSSFESYLRRALPTTFRINSNLPFEQRKSIIDLMQGKFAELFEQAAAAPKPEAVVASEGHEESHKTPTASKPTLKKTCTPKALISPPHELEWYPAKGECWQLGAQLKEMRSVKSLKSCYDFIIRENEIGNITRQEAVSMLPPILLDVKPHHKILDMCAAPGSKTIQLVEALQGRTGTERMSSQISGESSLKEESGFLVANDNNLKRTYLLIHRVQALKNPAFAVTCHEAQNFPTPLYRSTSKSNSAILPTLFDRILCDVPCSGDGTMRKNPDIWRRWKIALGMGLHRIQKRIAMRGAKLLKPGGIMVYSTCSFNPVENEAVVAELIRCHHGELELVPVPENTLKGLRRRPGMSTWRVALPLSHLRANSDQTSGSSGENKGEPAKQKSTSESTTDEDPSLDFSFVDLSDLASNRQYLDAAMFPPTPSEAKTMHLDRCWRMMPHDQDTGGFFVAVLKKRKSESVASKPFSNTDENFKTFETEAGFASSPSPSNTQAAAGAAASATVAKRECNPFIHKAGDLDHYVAFTAPCHQKDWEILRDFYGLSDEGELSQSRLFTTTESAAMISWIPKPLTDSIMDFTLPRRLKIVRAGIPVFRRKVRPGVSCKHVLRQDTLTSVLPHLGRRKIKLTKIEDMKLILVNGFEGKDTLLDELSGPVSEELHKLERGSMCFYLSSYNDKNSPGNESDCSKADSTVCIVAWRGNNSVTPTVNKRGISDLLKKLEGYKGS